MLFIDRASTELRRGRGLVVRSPEAGCWLFVAVECLTPDAWQQLQQLPGDGQLFLSAQRAVALGVAPLPESLGLEQAGHELPFRLSSQGMSLGSLWHWAGLDVGADEAPSDGARLKPESSHAPAAAALTLARRGRLVPAVAGWRLPVDRGKSEDPTDRRGGGGPYGGLDVAFANGSPSDRVGEAVFSSSDGAPGIDPAPQAEASHGPGAVGSGLAWSWLQDVLQIDAGQVLEHARIRPVQLQQVSAAPVPLADDASSRFVLFRELDSDFEHVAVVVGEPDLTGGDAVRVRLHSSCLTGDLFGSLRCDCGDQLRGTVARLAASGGGIVLYLSQEGRGIGLANKLRAYVRQDQGLDTLDANHALGFRMDERHFEVAAAMLQALGCRRINLLTNNPAKIAALRNAGIDVLDREAVLGEVNPHNQRYLVTKLRRGGHLFDEDSLQQSG